MVKICRNYSAFEVYNKKAPSVGGPWGLLCYGKERKFILSETPRQGALADKL
jgi:hypothetical protein